MALHSMRANSSALSFGKSDKPNLTVGFEKALIFESQFTLRGIDPDTHIEAGHAVVSRLLAVLLRSVKDAYFRGWERTPYLETIPGGSKFFELHIHLGEIIA